MGGTISTEGVFGIHYYETRAQHNIHLNRTKHEYAKECLRYDVPKVINDTPTAILDKINTHCPKGFATYIKHYFPVI